MPGSAASIVAVMLASIHRYWNRQQRHLLLPWPRLRSPLHRSICSPAYCLALAWLNGNCNCNCRRIASLAQLVISKRSQAATKLRQAERVGMEEGRGGKGEERRWEANDRLRWKADSQGNDMQLQLLLNETSMKHAAPIGLCSMRVVAVSACSVSLYVYNCECVCVYCKTVTRQLSMRNVLRAFKTYSYLMGLPCSQFDII